MRGDYIDEVVMIIVVDLFYFRLLGPIQILNDSCGLINPLITLLLGYDLLYRGRS